MIIPVDDATQNIYGHEYAPSCDYYVSYTVLMTIMLLMLTMVVYDADRLG